MRAVDSHRTAVLPVVAFSLAVAVACAPESEPPESGASQQEAAALGSVDFAVSCDPAVADDFDRAVAFLHHMMYQEARNGFQQVAGSDPDCAMAHWGIAMTLFQPLWPTRPGPAELERGRAAIARAKELGLPTERERAYVEAVEAFYTEPAPDYGTRLRRFEEAMGRVREAHPDDRDAGAFHALAHLATASQTDRSLAHQRRAREILARIHEADPRHPGAIHYAIHAHDVEALADEGVEYAHAYDEIAPSVPHALHMPTHIFVRLGEWDEVIHWNRRSADAALEFPAGDHISHHYPHALDYLTYAHLQRAEDGEARVVLDELLAREGYQPTFISGYALAAIPARYALERRQWSEAAALPIRAPTAFPWENHPGAEAITHFARGIGAARSGDLEGARRAARRLSELKARSEAADDAYWARQAEIQRLAVAAWVSHAEGRPDEARESMRASAELDAATEKNPVTPGAVLPARELLGDLLLELERPAEALAAYEASLETWPRRFNTLLGAARAADRAGDREAARSYYDQLVNLAAKAATRPGLEEARRYLEGGRVAAGSR